MDKFVIEGGKRLSGTVRVNSSKNAVLPILAGSLLLEKGEVIINKVPDLADIHTMVKVLEHLGATVKTYPGDRKLVINSESLNKYEAPYELVSKMRASFLVLGPLLARLKKTKVSLPGGCVIGPRPVNLHVMGFSKLGAKISEEHGYVIASCDRLKGNTIYFDRPSHTGTENIIMGATLAEGRTTIVNAASDPEVVDLACFLNSMGAGIQGAGSSTVTINGVKKLKPTEYTPIPDRLEAATFMMAAAITGGYLEIKNVIPEHLGMVKNKLLKAGVEISEDRKRIKVKGPKRLKAVSVTTYPFPGFPTDMQASVMALTCVADGTSHIRETVFEDRFSQVMEFNRLGADIKVSGDRAAINGVKDLRGASVMASDIRAGAGLVLAGLVASGVTEILRVYHIDRGYERIENKLRKVGAQIERKRA
ncbi:MAG: UDP-N-acetylglucosamine 1-carboxyvinyltransferase [candidate division Zixibacteria bacterium SM23_73_2]|nr:MAG: UDP-N-acetylglucosamine 1-carboxyvinyltransferase [candidate division Zixibacteria bacterium SM23_73_2]